MDHTTLNHLKSLHTNAIDARNGYREALKDAEGKGLTPLFGEMIAMHEKHAAELARMLENSDETPSEKGSFMTVVHETIMDVRSLFNALDESVLPGLIDGEKRNVAKYDEVLKDVAAMPEVTTLLMTQRDRIASKISAMETQQAFSKAP